MSSILRIAATGIWGRDEQKALRKHHEWAFQRSTPTRAKASYIPEEGKWGLRSESLNQSRVSHLQGMMDFTGLSDCIEEDERTAVKDGTARAVRFQCVGVM